LANHSIILWARKKTGVGPAPTASDYQRSEHPMLSPVSQPKSPAARFEASVNSSLLFRS